MSGTAHCVNLLQIEPKNATAEEIKEAFCRDIDSLAFEMEVEKDIYLIIIEIRHLSDFPGSEASCGYC